MTHEPRPLRDLLPPALTRPFAFIWFFLVPQAALLLLNYRSWWLASGEMSAAQRADSLGLGAMEGVLLLLAGLAMLRSARGFSWLTHILLLFAHVAYLWVFTARLEHLLPDAVSVWILTPTQIAYHQYALVMPALFYLTLRLACFPSGAATAWDAGRSLLVMIVAPAACYVFFNLPWHWARLSHHSVPIAVLFTGLVVATLLMIGAILRLLALLWRRIGRTEGPGYLTLLALVGLVGPIAGLLLNRSIPFPADFQSVTVYLLAALNGIVLLLPNGGPSPFHRLAWLTQCLLYPFTAYFFLVFLPFLPLSILALFAVGAGFLMMVPTILFALHTQVVWRGISGSAVKRPSAAIALAAIAVMPACIVGRAWQDREGLGLALDYVYDADCREGRFTGDPEVVRRSLEHLRDFKQGLEMPFLSDFYNSFVFGGFVLPDEKMNHIHNVFFGSDVPKPAARDALGLFHDRRRPRGSTRTATPVPRTAILTDISCERAIEEDCEKTLATLKIHNSDSALAEYVADIHVPAGALISGFWLNINGARVPGRIFEKKTAQWVYQMIRDRTRRDPGLLTYKDPETVELRVYPVAAGETRELGIEFLWPAGFAPDIRIDGRAIDTASTAQPSIRFVTSGAETLALIPPARAATIEGLERETCLHFIIDRSRHARPWNESLRLCRQVAAQFPEVHQFAFTAANYEWAHPLDAPSRELPDLPETSALPATGGFARDRAIKAALAWHQDQARPATPMVVVVTADASGGLQDEDLPWFASMFAGQRGFLIASPDAPLLQRDFSDVAIPDARPLPVMEFQVGETRLTAPVGQGSAWLEEVPGKTAAPTIACVRYQKGMDAWLQFRRELRESGPKDAVKKLVATSRDAGVLTPATACIVVENSAQWKIMEEREGEKLRKSEALDFMESPEPSTWILGGGLLAWLAWRRKRFFPGRRII